MPACRGNVTDPWFELGRRFNCQRPAQFPNSYWLEKVGCDHGCRVCGDEILTPEFNLTGFLRVHAAGRRSVRSHTIIEARDAKGVPNLVRSPSITHALRIPSTWVGELAPCRDDLTTTEFRGEPICRCRTPNCDGMLQAWCPWAGGHRETCNIYLGIQWPLRYGVGIFCTGDGFPLCAARDSGFFPRVCVNQGSGILGEEGPIRIVFVSERAELDQASFVRTGRNSCASNLGIRCWGVIEDTPGCTTHHNEDLSFPHFRFECTHYNGCSQNGEDRRWRFFQAIEVRHLSARLRDDGTYVNKADVRARNAAIEYIENDPVGEPYSITKLRGLLSQRVGGNEDGGSNSVLDAFSREYAARSIEAAPAVAKFSGTYLRHSRAQLTDVEYVIRSGFFSLSFVPHLVLDDRKRYIYPIVKAHLSLKMGVRVAKQTHTWHDQDIAIENGPNWFPVVDGRDEIIYVDEQGDKLLYPPPKVEVEFDLGPFSTPQWSPVEVRTDECLELAAMMFNAFTGQSLFVPAFKTNQDHSHAYDVWKGGMNIRWGFGTG